MHQETNMWFTADTHFGHNRILELCNRPFGTIEEMNKTILENINARVKETDILYHLGDFAWGKEPDLARPFRDKIKCKNVVMVTGNHDPRRKDGTAKARFAEIFQGCYDLLRLEHEINGLTQTIVLSHYAMRVWDKSHYGSWNLFGHSHGKLDDLPKRLQIDVGVDCHNFSPINLQQVTEIMQSKSFVPMPKHPMNQNEFDVWAAANGEK